MRSLLITGEYPPMRGGVADYSRLLTAGLQKLGVDVTVLTSSSATGGSSPSEDRVVTSVRGWGTGLWRDVADQVARFQPDVIHIQYQTGAFGMRVGVNLLPWVTRLRSSSPPVIVTFHDLKEPFLLPKLGPLRHLATIALATAATAIVVTNPEDYGKVAGSASSERAHVYWGGRKIAAMPIGSNIPPLPPGFERARVRETIGARAEEFLISFFGFIVPSKGLETLVTAFESLVERGQPVRLMMVGAGSGDSGHPDRTYEGSIRRRLDTPRLRGRVTWTGFLHSTDVAAFLAASDACCLPFRDGVSLRHGTLVAAIELGLPIVTTSGPGALAHERFPKLEPDRNVVLVTPGSPERLAEALERLIADCGFRRELAAGSRSLAAGFSWEAISASTFRLYQDVALTSQSFD